MDRLTIYSSAPADPQLVGFALALSQNYCLRPLTALPAPDPDYQQRQRLLVARAELSLELDEVETALARPQGLDAGERNGLEFRRQALLSRRQAIGRTLERGGPADG